MKQLILGGARSGKSRYAEQQLVQNAGDDKSLIYVATATADDGEMNTRIQQHQSRRDESWRLIEEPLLLAEVISSFTSNDLVLIDCLTLWISNCLHHNVWTQYKNDFLQAYEQSQATIILVSNEVGQGVVPMGELSRRFVDETGWLHQDLAALSERVTMVVAGLPMTLKETNKNL